MLKIRVVLYNARKNSQMYHDSEIALRKKKLIEAPLTIKKPLLK